MLKENLDIILKEVSECKQKVRIIPVCKKKPFDVYYNLLALGLDNFAENYAQEAIDKRKQFEAVNLKILSDVQDDNHFGFISKEDFEQKTKQIKWHFIGQLQSNKLKKICQYFDVIHSLDRLDHAKKMNEHLQTMNKYIEVLIHVNLNNEQQKSGINAEDLCDFVESLKTFKQIKLRGLMTFPSQNSDGHHNLNIFNELNKLLQSQKANNFDASIFNELSMGVSSDYTQALKAGATMIRLGTALLGKRR